MCAKFDEMKIKVGKSFSKTVKDGQVLGLGTGSTAKAVINAIGERIREEGIIVYGIPTSFDSKLLAINARIKITSLEEHDPDVSFDGADEVDPFLNLIKGRGGAMTWEKVVDTSAGKFVVVVDESKLVDRLGENFPVPIEVLPSAVPVVRKKLSKLNPTKVELRMAQKKDGPVITDNGNFILDAYFGFIRKELEEKINNLPGVVDNGLFIGVADEVLVATKSGVEKRTKRIE